MTSQHLHGEVYPTSEVSYILSQLLLSHSEPLISPEVSSLSQLIAAMVTQLFRPDTVTFFNPKSSSQQIPQALCFGLNMSSVPQRSVW